MAPKIVQNTETVTPEGEQLKAAKSFAELHDNSANRKEFAGGDFQRGFTSDDAHPLVAGLTVRANFGAGTKGAEHTVGLTGLAGMIALPGKIHQMITGKPSALSVIDPAEAMGKALQGITGSKYNPRLDVRSFDQTKFDSMYDAHQITESWSKYAKTERKVVGATAYEISHNCAATFVEPVLQSTFRGHPNLSGFAKQQVAKLATDIALAFKPSKALEAEFKDTGSDLAMDLRMQLEKKIHELSSRKSKIAAN